jgi:hypothetical protein
MTVRFWMANNGKNVDPHIYLAAFCANSPCNCPWIPNNTPRNAITRINYPNSAEFLNAFFQNLLQRWRAKNNGGHEDECRNVFLENGFANHG